MFVEFDELPDSARIWIYQSNKEFTEDQIAQMEDILEQFVTDWTRHGRDLKGSFSIRHNLFVILGVDESFSEVSGCSIDASTHVFKQFEQEFNIDLFDKMNTAFRSGQHINVVKLSDFQRFAKERKIDSSTLVFNNMVQTKGQLDEDWEVTAAKSWHNRYFNS